MPLPIVFIHNGNSDYLFYALWQAKQSNSASPIILLGDEANAYYRWLLGIEHYPTKCYAKEAHIALKQYIHLSTNGEDFELFCLKRWFILYEFLKSHSEIKRCVYLDSDVLVYDSLEIPANELANFGMAMVSYSAHTNFINDIDFLGDFCSFVQRHYDDPTLRQWLHEHYKKYIDIAGAGGISDMTFFHKFRDEHPEKLGTLVYPMGQAQEAYTFDERLDSDFGGYELKEGLKNIVWIDGIPYCRHLPTMNMVKFYTIHFQGKLKSRIKNFISSQSPKTIFISIVSYAFFLFQKITKKLLITFRLNKQNSCLW